MDEATGVTAGAVDAIDITWTPGRCFLANLMIGAGATTPAIALLVAVGSLTSGRSPAVFLWQMALMWAVYIPTFAGFSVLLTRRYPPILRFGATGVELAASRRDVVFIPWRAVRGARFRYRGPLTALEFVLNQPQAATRMGRTGRRPYQRRRSGQVSYLVDVAQLHPGRDAIRTHLHRHCPILG